MGVDKPEPAKGMEAAFTPALPDRDYEAKLIRHVSRGDKDALIEVYEKYIDRVYSYFYSRVEKNIADAQDLTSETFTRAIEMILRGQFVWQGKPFSAWLFGIARNVLQEHRRKSHNLSPVEDLDDVLEVSEPISQEADISDALVQKEEQVALWNLVKTLPSMQQQVVIMRHAYGMSYSEIASRLGRSEQASKQLHYRALNSLKRLIHNKASMLKPT
jgi:RNA polymerase sigma factor (sigma-70 family)